MIDQVEPDDMPIQIDWERMRRAVAGPRWTMPSGLTREQRHQFITDCANGLIPPDAPKD